MADGITDDHKTFFQIAREFPVRTSLYTFGLPCSHSYSWSTAWCKTAHIYLTE